MFIFNFNKLLFNNQKYLQIRITSIIKLRGFEHEKRKPLAVHKFITCIYLYHRLPSKASSSTLSLFGQPTLALPKLHWTNFLYAIHRHDLFSRREVFGVWFVSIFDVFCLLNFFSKYDLNFKLKSSNYSL